MAKYAALRRFLETHTTDVLSMTFKEVEKVLGAKLPASAYGHPAWWANDYVSHVQARAWLDAGYETEQVNVAAKTVEFRRMEEFSMRSGVEENKRAFKPDPAARPLGRHPMIGAMKGWATIEPGYDLTQPAMPEWAEMLDEKYGPEKGK